MDKFKAGDKVVRIGNSFKCVSVGKTYFVGDVKYNEYLILLDEYGNLIDGDYGYDPDLFELAELVKTPRPHADLIKQWADDNSLEIEYKSTYGKWFYDARPSWFAEWEYQIKPQKKTELEILKEEAAALNAKIQALENNNG